MLSSFFDSHRILAIAHRGGARLRPENTLAAFDHAVSLEVDAIELDVRLSRDHDPVVIHDARLDRTTDATGPVSGLSVAELGRLDAGYRFGPDQGFPFRGQGVGIVTLREVLARFPFLPFIIEVKGESEELARRTIGVIVEMGAEGRVVVGGFNARSMRAARAAGPKLTTSACTPEVRWALYRSYLGLAPRPTGYRLFQVPEVKGATRVVSRRFVQAASRAGVPVQVWTVNEADDMRRLVEWGVRAIISDRPDTAVDVVQQLSR
jgi:glycerophosphoryl diester phosphodiesterase